MFLLDGAAMEHQAIVLREWHTPEDSPYCYHITVDLQSDQGNPVCPDQTLSILTDNI